MTNNANLASGEALPRVMPADRRQFIGARTPGSLWVRRRKRYCGSGGKAR